MNINCLTLLTYLSLVIKLCSAGALPMSIYEQKKYHKQIEAQGLYDANDKVIILTKSIFQESVYNQEYATLVEFYNAYCGFCKRYAPKYKEFAADVYSWQGVAQVAAIDCSADENHDLCREFEIMGYPSVRYFKPNFKDERNNFGITADGENKDDLRTKLIELLKNETDVPAHWPNLNPITDSNIKHLFNDVPNTVEYIFLINSFDNSDIPIEVILDLHAIKRILIRQIDSVDIAHSFGLKGTVTLVVVTRNLEIIPMHLHRHNRLELRTAIEKFVSRRIKLADENVRLTNAKVPTPPQTVAIKDIFPSPQEAATIKLVKSMEPTIYQADLEQALKFTLFHEIPQFAEIRGERLLALQRYISLLQR